MNFTERIRNTINWLDSQTLKTLNAFEVFLYFMIAVDVFGLYWYLHQKKFAMGLLIALLFLLVGTYIFKVRIKAEKEAQEIMGKPTKKKVDKKIKSEEDLDEDDEDNGLSFDMGIDVDDYNKRLKKALG